MSSPNPSSPERKVVVITGASSGIGAALALECHRRGHTPVLAARREAELARVAASAGDALFIPTDVTRRQEVERMIAKTLERHGRVDVLVNNAGRGISRLVSELTDEDIDEMMTVNVKSVLYGMQAVLPHFKARGTGHIINVSSMLGRVPFYPVRSAYSASKHFVNALTANLRMELSQSHPGIAVSLFSPGVVATEFGIHARHGGADSRVLPNAQPPQEVAALIADLIDSRAADVYSRPVYKASVIAYYSAEDITAVERGFMRR